MLEILSPCGMRPQGSAQELERRRRAVQAVKEGSSVAQVARVLVSLARSNARNSGLVPGKPAPHLLVGPRPLEGVGIQLVVLAPRLRDMPDELLPAAPGCPLEVAVAEGVDQQLRLVQPRGPRRGQPGPPPAVAAVEVVRRLGRDVA